MLKHKRLPSSQTSNPQLFDCDVSDSDEEYFAYEILSKYRKYPKLNREDSVFKVPHSPMSTMKSKSGSFSILNPFDLSNPQPKSTDVKNFIWYPSLSKNTISNIEHESSPPKELGNCKESVEHSSDSGFESNSSSESLLSFASRSSDEDMVFNVSSISDISWSETSPDLLYELQQISDPVNSCEETGYLLPIVTDSSSDDRILIPQISPLTLANILSGNHTLNNNITVFDCRFPYEYAGGHIANSINVHTCQKLLQTLFPIKESGSDWKEEIKISDLGKTLQRDDRIYIFYCEFSSYRAPNLAQCLRQLDRLANVGGRDLFIPNIYVLFGGYRDFYTQYPQLCFPNGYVGMKEASYPLRHCRYEDANEWGMWSPKNKNQLCSEEKLHLREARESKNKFDSLISKSTKEIFQLFSSHPIISGS